MGSHKSFEKKGLVIIAMHRGEGSEAEIAWLVAAKKWPFPVFKDGFVKDLALGANPQIVVFEASGKVAFAPSDSGDFTKVMNAKVAEAPDWLLGGGPFAKMAAQAKEVLARKNLGKVLTEAVEKSKSEDEKEKEEAEQIADRLKRYADGLAARATRWVEDGRPAEALEILKTLSEQFKDSDIGKKAAEDYAKQKDDEAFKKELEAEKLWKAIEPSFYKVVPPKKADDPEKWRVKNAGVLKPILDKLAALATKCGETKACAAYKKRAAWMAPK